MKLSLRGHVSDLGSFRICATLHHLCSFPVFPRTCVSSSVGGLLHRRDLFHRHSSASMASSSESVHLLMCSSFYLVSPTVLCSFFYEKCQLLQPSNRSSPAQPDLKLIYFTTAGSVILCSINGVTWRLLSSASGLMRSTGAVPFRSLYSLRPPKGLSPPLLLLLIPSVPTTNVRLIWDVCLPEPLPPPEPPDSPNLASVPFLFRSSGLLMELTHSRQSNSFFEALLMILVSSWCYLFPCQIQHLLYGSVKEQSFIGMVISIGLSKKNNVGILMLIRVVQAKSPGVLDGVWTDCLVLIIERPFAIKITSLRTPMIHILVRQKLDPNCPITSTNMVMVIQTSSRQGRERSFHSSSFLKERIHSPTSLFDRGDFPPVFKFRKNYQFPNRLLSYVMVHLGPVDATILSQMRVEVMDGVATSHCFVTNRSFEDFEVRFEPFLVWIASGNFDIFYNVLSNFFKFVSLSLYSLELYVEVLAYRLIHRGLYDDVFSIVIV
ncbi:hypothetical protein N665_0093s0063 [Sinapis alba]|nr:hypothetical protein N665_0093s0063 [Sinapis alba]